MQPAAANRRRQLAEQHVLIYQLYQHGEQVFDGLAPFRTWLEQPNKALSDKRPIELLTNPQGFAEVDDVLTRLEYGVY